ncbi:MAG: SUMF1/EgtB/PvdO family nonheme iron enzyme [Candidatus Brocadiae bacterium]|nr:SUMF1/EgtB/PvdO family nonheme iron enzyme [Candidatus Brocadiia bacterium]
MKLLLLALALSLLLCASCGKDEAPDTASRAAPKTIATKSGIDMVRIPGGWFLMGSRTGEPDEAPVHKVWVDPFLMDRTEVTQAAFRRLQFPDPSVNKNPQCPVEMVSIGQAARFCNERSEAEGLEPCYDLDSDPPKCNFQASGYRLPTEAEWEYACRAGSTTRYSFGRDTHLLSDHAWFADNAARKSHPVGTRRPNPWGLVDMHGNVAEWCNDLYGAHYYASSPARNPRGPARGQFYVLRGGGWKSSADLCCSAYRVEGNPGLGDACFAQDETGFRCVRKAPDDLANLGGSREAPPAPTGLVYDKLYLQHDTGPGFPERPQRLTAIVTRLRQRGLMGRLTAIRPSAHAAQWIATIHDPAYVQRVQRSCQQGAARLDTPDVPVCPRSYAVAVAAVQGVLSAVDAVVAGKVRNAFCAVRPPGHHALRSRAMGFCIFNNVAIAARYAQREHKLPKVLIVDWDVHHGNGTQAAFYDDPSVFYFGIHRAPFYPGTGAATERGKGKGLGTTLNVPVAAGSGDAVFVRAFEEKLLPAAIAFQPDFVLISAGFDAHKSDPLGGCALTAAGYARLTRIVKAIAERCCKGRLVSVLEGGYNLDALADSVEAHLRALME